MIGAVKNSDVYLADLTMNLGDAIALAGGATPTGTVKGVRVTRGARQLAQDFRLNELGTMPPASGDLLAVPERIWLAHKRHLVIGATISAIAILISRN